MQLLLAKKSYILLHEQHFTTKLAPKMMSIASMSSQTHPVQENPILCLLETCKSMDQLKQIHSQTITTGQTQIPIVQNKLISLCCNGVFGDMSYARTLFDAIAEPNGFHWNTLIKGYSRIPCPKMGVGLYVEMLKRGVRPDCYTFPMLLKGFDRGLALRLGRELHCHVAKYGLESNVFVQIALINMYSLCELVDLARGVFDMCEERDIIVWNSMISGYNRVQRYDEGLKLFYEMENGEVRPTWVTLVSVLSACSKLKDVECGRQVHIYVNNGTVEPNLVLENALLEMYASCGYMDAALAIFDNMKDRDVISWTSVINGFVNLGQISIARTYFDHMPQRDYVTWTSMIDGYIRLNYFREALMLFRKMQASSIRPDQFTMVSILTACAQLGALELGEWVRTYMDRNKVKVDTFVGNALIDMYCKCGSVEKALKIFHDMPRRDKFTWTAIIVGLAIHGHGKEALVKFARMLKASITPDDVTYVGLLCAFTHTGMVEKGRKFFTSMTKIHGIEPNVTHYGCFVDLLGRAGNINEAHEVIKNMPMKPNSVLWGALLGACRIHKDAKTAEIAAEKILELEPDNGSSYVLLCNVYAACNKLDNLRELRKLMMTRGIKKIPGCSLIEMNGEIHEFVAGDSSHPRTNEIYLKLDEMATDLKAAGYSPDTGEVFLDTREEDKESAVYRHSEKLAIAFGLISSESGVTIRVVKNLRMCVDCHCVAKLVTKLYQREVIVRDRTRFHHFRHGSCSCKDYW